MIIQIKYYNIDNFIQWTEENNMDYEHLGDHIVTEYESNGIITLTTCYEYELNEDDSVLFLLRFGSDNWYKLL